MKLWQPTEQPESAKTVSRVLEVASLVISPVLRWCFGRTTAFEVLKRGNLGAQARIFPMVARDAGFVDVARCLSSMLLLPTSSARSTFSSRTDLGQDWYHIC